MQSPIVKPTHPCWSCGGSEYYQHYEPSNQWICKICHPQVFDEKK